MLKPRLTFLLPLLLLFWIGCDADSDHGEPPVAEQIDDLDPTVVLVSIDGLRWDYLDLHDAPTLSSLKPEAAYVERFVPVFPTKTFPNQYTLVTGLYPANHGIISNNMYDAEMEASFSLGNREAVEDGRWWEGEPLWVTAEQQGQTAATFFWPGSEAPIGGVRPTYWMEYDGSIPGEARVDQVLEWLDQPRDDRPTFSTLYFSKVDSEGHSHGPESEEAAHALREVDGYINRLLQGLQDRDIKDQVNLIIASDHGMSPTSPERVVFLDDHLNLDDVHVVDYDPVAMINPREGRTTARAIIEALSDMERVDVYHRDELPDTLHFRNHHRIPEVIVSAEDTWSITTHSFFNRDPSRFEGGSHGYDPRVENMHTLLLARGPAFEAGAVKNELSFIHLYEVMAAILGLEPAPNDGNLEAACDLLREEIFEEVGVAAP